MTIRNVFLLVCMAMVAVPVWAWDYTFRNGYTEPIQVSIKTRSNNPWVSELLNPGEKHVFSTGGLCIDGLKVRFGGKVNPKAEEMVGGEELETHPGFYGGKIDTLPQGAFGLYCGNFNGVFEQDGLGALVLSEDRIY